MKDLTFAVAAADVETLARCPACDAADGLTDVADVGAADGTTILTTAVCGRCALIFRRRRPTLAWFERMWTLRDAAQRRAGGVPFNAEVERRRYERYARTAALLRQYGFGRRLIDVGCGPAGGLRAFAEAGFQATGLEPDPSRARFVRVPEVEIVEAAVEQFAPQAAGRFDGAACQHSLEHFHRPRDVLAAVATLVPDDGLIYVEVPDFRQAVRDWNDATYLAHLTNFVEESLVALARRVGLSLVGRERPPADAPGETHLACVFRKSAGRIELPPVAVPPIFADEVRAVYARGLPTPPPAGVLRFVVPCVNDISLGFKGDPSQVRSTVGENFADRTLEFDADLGAYRIRAV